MNTFNIKISELLSNKDCDVKNDGSLEAWFKKLQNVLEHYGEKPKEFPVFIDVYPILFDYYDLILDLEKLKQMRTTLNPDISEAKARKLQQVLEQYNPSARIYASTLEIL